jgi:nucleotide sugar dehydrogenase
MPKAMMLKRKDIDTREKREKYTVCILGCGQTGLKQACLFAKAGFRVVYVDTDHRIFNQTEKGRIPSAGRNLNTFLNNYIRHDRLKVENDVRKATSASDIIVFSVPAAINKRRSPDYSYLMKGCKEVGLSLRQGSLFIFTSKIGPGVTERLVKESLEKSSGLEAGRDFGLAYSPLSGQILQDGGKYRRVVGAINEQSLKTACVVLGAVTKGEIVEMRDLKTAETVELLEKVYETVNIALANELAGFCEEAGIDFMEARKAASGNPHSHIPRPQLVGCSAIAEPHLLNDEAEALNKRLRMLALAGRANEEMIGHTVRLVKDTLRACGKNLSRAKISVFGVSSRRNTRETEGSLVNKLVDALKKRGGHVWVYDSLFSHKELVEMGYQAERTLTRTVEKSDCLVIAVGHKRFRRLNLRRFQFLVKKPAAIVDMGRVIDPDRAEKEGFVYRGVGRGVLASKSLD